MIRTIISMLLISSATQSFAQETPSPDAVVDQIVENSSVDQNGLVQPETGGALPVENWFGCNPKSDDAAADVPCDTTEKTQPEG